MSTVIDGNETYMLLDTSQLVEPEATNVRPRSADDEDEINAITALAATIEEEGQLQPVKARRTPDADTYELVMGRRRKKAIELINAGRKAGEELRIKVLVVDMLTDPSAFRQACIENLHRKNMSPMQMYDNIQTVRGNFKWDGAKGTKKVAEFFKVSPATVTQYEMLGKLPEELQAQVHSGETSRDDAFRLAKIAEKAGPDAAKSAAQAGEAAAEEVAQGASAMGVGGVGAESTGDPAHAHETPDEKAQRLKKAKQTKKAKAAKSKAIKDKAREAGDAAPRSKKEILEFFTSCYGPAYGYPNGAVHQFVDALEKYAAGELSDRTLYKYWDACVENAAKGTADSAQKAADNKSDNKSETSKSDMSKSVVTAAAGKTKKTAKTTKKNVAKKKK